MKELVLIEVIYGIIADSNVNDNKKYNKYNRI